jgi:uncharacterized protein (TIRG00374 family)
MSGRTKSWIYRIIAFIIGIGILLALIYHAGFERFLDIILQTSPYWIAVSVIVYAASWIFRTWRLELFTTHAGKNIAIFDIFKLYISGYALNVILPAKLGDVATVGYLKMKGINIGRSAAIILQTRILDVLSLILLSIIPAFILFTEKAAPNWIRTTIFICLFAVAIPIGIVVLDKNKLISGLLEKFGNKFSHKSLKLVVEKIKDAYEAYHEIVLNKKLLVASILLSLMIWLFDGLVCYAVSIAVGTQISIVVVVLAVSLANVGKSAPATPGSIGIYESVLAAVLVLFGVSFDVAIVIAILDHAIKNLFTLAIGVPATAGIGLNVSELYTQRDVND